MDKRISDNFKNPEIIYRSAPFWSWNDELEVEKLKYQLDKIEEGGFGGTFIHSRIGLITPYLSDKWMSYIEEIVKYAKDKGMKIYLYDEDRWPSGFAGGIIPEKKENRIKILKVWKKKKRWYKKLVNGENSEWFNGFTYIDTMNEKTVNCFIKSTYEKYFKSLKNFIPHTIPVIFTDEPNYFHWRIIKKSNKNVYYFPWTKNLRKIFKLRFGYDIYEKINLLIEEKDGFEKIRYDYSKLISELFIKNFGENIYNFCEKNKISFTGHYLCEDTIESQITYIGDVMSLYEFMHWPGVDHLGRNLKNPLTLKQCSSVANQLGKERVLSELYGCSGQNFTLSERKWIGDWHISLGINFFCPHLYLYSLKGCRKRDYPPTISHHQPYWKYQKELEDYFARLNFIMSQGRFLSDILVIHPIETGWALKGSKKLKKYDEEFLEIIQKLLENKFEYELGNENIMEEYGEIVDDKFKIGRCEYKYVVIPPLITLRKTTVELIKKFISNGGVVFASEKFPYLIEGKKEEIDFKKDCILYSSVNSLIEKLKKEIKREIEIYGEKYEEITDLLIHRRRIDENIDILFLNNTSKDNSYKFYISLMFKGNVYKADPFKGEIFNIEINEDREKMIIEEELPPIGSSIFIIDKSENPLILKKEKTKEKIEKSVINDWEIYITKPNILIIDFCKFKRGKDKRWSKKLPVLQVQQILEKENKKQKINLLFEFENENFDEELYLVCEEIERYSIKINNKILKNENIEEWLDPSFKKIRIDKKFFKKGKNRIEMCTVFIPPKKKNTLIFRKNGTEIESIYLLGNFIVKSKKFKYENGGYFLNYFSITKKEKSITKDDINLQGYPFYAGSLVGIKEIDIKKEKTKKYFLKFDEFKCIVAKIKINGKEVGIIYLPPYEIEITNYLKEGKNIVEVELFSSLRNLFGPHHLKEHNPEYVGPYSFIDETERWFKSKGKTTDYSTIPFGIGKICLIEKYEEII